MPKYIFFDRDEHKINDYKCVLHSSQKNFYFVCSNFDEIINKYYGKVAFVLVSPANSYGNMKGGIDRLYIKRFPHIEHAVIDSIKEFGQKDSIGKPILPVGSITHVKLDEQGNVLIILPTMETPRNIIGTNNISKAFKALFEYTFDLPPNVHIFIPCLGTGIGGLTGNESAEQIKILF